jgi:hypothetical protein
VSAGELAFQVLAAGGQQVAVASFWVLAPLVTLAIGVAATWAHVQYGRAARAWERAAPPPAGWRDTVPGLARTEVLDQMTAEWERQKGERRG